MDNVTPCTLKLALSLVSYRARWSEAVSHYMKALKRTFTLFQRYDDGMSEMKLSEARARLADVVDAARVGHDPVYLTRRGQRVAAVIAADDLDRLISAAEALADIEAARAARSEIAEGEPAIPWEQVKADLGLA